MNRKIIIILFLLLQLVTQLYGQIENPDASIRFENIEDDFKSPEGLEFPPIEAPKMSNPKDPFSLSKYENLGLEISQPLDITKNDGFIDHVSDTAPKYFKKDKEVKGEYARDQYLGDFKTNAKFVNILYRDHEYVDGDRIRVFVNEDIVQSNISLHGRFNGFTLMLEPGFNRIEFQALNQGSSGPNTAELQVFDDNGVLISANRWNLTTGKKATIIIVKE